MNTNDSDTTTTMSITPAALADKLSVHSPLIALLLPNTAVGDDAGVRIESKRDLVHASGRSRARQAWAATAPTRAVYNMLGLTGETIYSRYGNQALPSRRDLPALSGPMEADVFAALKPADFVIVVNPNKPFGRDLIAGQIELVELNSYDFDTISADADPETRIRIGNGRDLTTFIRTF